MAEIAAPLGFATVIVALLVEEDCIAKSAVSFVEKCAKRCKNAK
jgi:hypothetical protein